MIRLEAVQVRDHYPAASRLLGRLHDSELSMNPRTAHWSAIENSYMRYVMEAQEENEGAFIMAFAGEEAIGFIFGYIDPVGDSNYETGTGDDLYVSDGYVEPGYRKQGIYTALNRELEQHFAGKKLRRIIRYTLSRNTTMQSWLAGQGYTPVRLVYEKWLN